MFHPRCRKIQGNAMGILTFPLRGITYPAVENKNRMVVQEKLRLLEFKKQAEIGGESLAFAPMMQSLPGMQVPVAG